MKTTDAPWKLRKQPVKRSTIVAGDHFRDVRKQSSRGKEDFPSMENEPVLFPLQQLLQVARQSGVAEPVTCATSLTMLVTGRAIHRRLAEMLRSLGLSEARFFTLVTLYMRDPVPSSSADLAYHTEITRSAMTGLLDTMAERGWICRRHRLSTDRRLSRVSLTDKGRKAVAAAIRRFLQFAAEISQDLHPRQHELLDEACALLRWRCMNPEHTR
jgi:DNA-binding MarR family transcriptional regulator